MPKIRLYNKDSNGNVIKKSGTLNLNIKNQLDKKDHVSGKYLFSELGTEPVINATPYDDRLTLEFSELDNVNKILGIPLIPVDGTDNFYISTLNLETIPNINLNEKRLFNENILSKPNTLNIKNYDHESSQTATKYITDNELIEQITEEISYLPYKESFEESSYTSDFEQNTIFDDINYNVKNLDTFEIVLDFTDNHDLYLTNTQLCFRRNSYDSFISDAHEETTWASQFNFKKGTQEAITSHFLTNAYWNNVEQRWEYNNNYLGHLSTQHLNDVNLKFPSNITGEESSDTGLNSINDTVDFVNNYITTSFINTTTFNDKYNSLPNKTKQILGVIDETYGFPKAKKWNPTTNQLIDLSKYISKDFEVEKVTISGNISVKAEIPEVKGNFQPIAGFNDNSTTRNEEFDLNSRKHKFSNLGVNFYLLDVKPNQKNTINDKIEFAYIHNSKHNSLNYVSNYSNTGLFLDEDNNEFSDINKYDLLDGSYISPAIDLEYRSLMSLNNLYYQKNDFNVIAERNKTNFYYLKNANNITENDPFDTNIKFRIYTENDYTGDLLTQQDDIFNIDSKFIDTQDKTYEESENNLLTNINLLFTTNSALSYFKDYVKYDMLYNVQSEEIEVNNLQFNVNKTLTKHKISGNAAEDTYAVRSNLLLDDLSGQKVDDEIIILSGKYTGSDVKKANDKEVIIDKLNNEVMVSRTGKKSSYDIFTKKDTYTLSPNSKLVFGVNSFNGFNSLPSYLKLKDKIRIKFYGKSIESKKNESNTTTAVKKTLTNNIQDQKPKVFKKSLTNRICLDSYHPSVDYIFENYLSKQYTTAHDALNIFKNNDNIKKYIFSENEENISDFVTTDWHKKFYLSKNKTNYKQKKYSSISKDKNFNTYYDTDTYSINSNIHDASKALRSSDEYRNFFNASSSYESSVKEYFLPFGNNTDETKHPGLSFIKNIDNTFTNENFAFEEDNNKSIEINADYVLTLQPLKIPNDYSTYSVNDSRNDYETSWCLVYEFVKESNESYEIINSIYTSVTNKDNIDYRQKINFENVPGIDQSTVLQNVKGFDIIYDKSFTIDLYLNTKFTQVPVPYKIPGYHKFKYLIYKQINKVIDTNYTNNLEQYIKSERIYVVIPIPKNNNIYNNIDFNYETQINVNSIKDLDFLPNYHSYNNNHNITDFTSFTGETGVPTSLKLKVPISSSYISIYPDVFVENSLIYTYFITGDDADTFGAFTKMKFTSYNNNDNVSLLLNKLPSDYKYFKNKRLYNSISTIMPEQVFATDPVSYIDNYKNYINNDSSDFENKVLYGNTYVSNIYKQKGDVFIKTNIKLVYSVRDIADVSDLIVLHGIISDLRYHTNYVSDENLLNGIYLNDNLRVYEPRLKNQNFQYDLKMSVPYFDINLSQKKENAYIFYPSFFSIKSIYLNKTTLGNINLGNEDLLITHGTPITVDDNDINTKSKFFIYSFNNNVKRKYKMPFSKIEGFRYGIDLPVEKRMCVYVSTSSFGQFADMSYDSVTYPEIDIERKEFKYNVTKEFYDETLTRITNEQIIERDNFIGSNKDENSAHYYPFVESTNNSNLEYLY